MTKPVQVEVVLSHSERLPAVDVWLVVDILRATTVMVRWFEIGGGPLYPVDSPESAFPLAERLRTEGETPLLMGEHNAIPPRGFDLGNSPLDLKRDLIGERSCAVMATTNGTKALLKAASTGTPVLAACARNAATVLDTALSKGSRLGIFCSGRASRPAWDDTLCAGLLISALTDVFPDICLADSARLALLTYREARGFGASLRSADHAVFLEKIGFGDDIAFAAEIASAASVPELYEIPASDGLRVCLREGAPSEGAFASEWGPSIRDALIRSSSALSDSPFSFSSSSSSSLSSSSSSSSRLFADEDAAEAVALPGTGGAGNVFLAGKSFKKQYLRMKRPQ